MKYTLLKFSFLLTFMITSCSTSVIEKIEPPIADITYVDDIKPIIDSNCISCHGAINPTAGLDLTTYTLVKARAETGAIITRVSSNSNPMPPAPNSRLTIAEIALIQEWINDGYKEN